MHSSIPAWRIPRTEEPGGLWSTGSQSRTQLKRLSTHTHAMLCGYSPSWPGKSPRRFALLFVFCSASCVEFLASLEYIQTHLREKHKGILQKERFSKG